MDSSSINQDLDSIIGTTTRIPRLTSADGFIEWKFRIERFFKLKEPKAWRSVLRGPTIITTSVPGATEAAPRVVSVKPIEEYTNEDFDNVEEDDKALSIISMALSPDIAVGFRQYKNAKDLWKALIDVYEGNEDMQQSRQDLLRQRFNMFNYVLGETLEAQIQRFVALTTELNTVGIDLPLVEVNKKLLNSLPRDWDLHVSVIKTTKDLKTISLAEMIAIIKARDLDNKQREINHVNSHSALIWGLPQTMHFLLSNLLLRSLLLFPLLL